MLEEKVWKQPNPFSEEVAAALATEDETLLNAMADTLAQKIQMVEEKERMVGEKLLLANQKGLLSSATKCRALLQKLARRKSEVEQELAAVRARLAEIEAKREIEAIRDLTEQIDAELFPTAQEMTELECPSFVSVYRHTAKSKRLSFVARLFAWTGLLGGLIGALVYMLLSEFNYAHFRLLDLAIFEGMTLGMLIVGMLFGFASNHQKKLADRALAEVEEEMRVYEAAVAEQQELLDAGCVPWKHENTTSAMRADALEYANRKAFEDAARERAERTQAQQIKAKLGEQSKRMIPVAVAIGAVIWILRRSKRKKKKAVKQALLSMLIDR